MTTNDINNVIVELYDLPLTKRKDDRFGRVVTAKSLNEDDLIAIAVSQRTDLNPITLKASIDILQSVAIAQIVNGASVNFGLGYINLGVNGVFVGDHSNWDSAKHSLSVRITPTAKLRKAVKACRVEVRGMAPSGAIVNTVTDVTTGEVNNRLTPGGGVKVTGTRIKIAGEHPSVGLRLINPETSEIIVIPATSLLLNDPSKIIFIVPIALVAGDYKISITTQFSTKMQMLKVPRTYIFDYVLNINN